MLVSQEHYEIPSSTSREQPIRPSASRLPGGFFFGASHDEYRSSKGRGRALLGKYARNRRDAYARRRYRGYLLAFPIPLGSTNVLFNAPSAAAFGRPPPECPVAAEPANEAAGEASTTKNAKATFTEVLDMGEAPL